MKKEDNKTPKGCVGNIVGLILAILALIYIHKTCGYDFLGSFSRNMGKINDIYMEFFSVIFS